MELFASGFVLQILTAPSGVGLDELVEYWPFLARIGWFLAGFIVVIGIGWFLIQPALARTVRVRNRNNPTIQEAMTRYFKLLLVVIALFVGAGIAGYGQILTNSALIIAAGTLAIGVAGQAVIGSLISGLVLVLDPEFNVGNVIEWADGKGTVQSITLRVTRVHTPDGELVTIPNTVLTSQAVTRPYGRGRYRVVEHIGIAYEADSNEAMQLIEQAAGDITGIISDPAPAVYIDDLGSDAVIIRVHYWIEDPRHRNIFRIRSRFAEAAKAKLEDGGVSISPASKRDLLGQIDVTRPE